MHTGASLQSNDPGGCESLAPVSRSFDSPPLTKPPG